MASISTGEVRQKAIGGGIGAILIGGGLWESGLSRVLRKMIELVGDFQTVESFGDAVLPLILIVAGCISVFWGFGGFEWLRNCRHLGPQRMPLMELRDAAIRRGWNFDGESLHCLDFTFALRQAGLDRTLNFWGRGGGGVENPALDPLRRIPSSHWRDYEIERSMLVATKDNARGSISYSMTGGASDRFYDVHVERRKALRWLRLDAEEFKGRRKSLVARKIS